MSAGKLLISVQPFAATKCLAWLVSKESPPPTCDAPSPVILNSAIIPYHTLLPVMVSLQYRIQKKNTNFTNPSVPNIMGRLNNCAGMSAGGQVI